MVKHTAVICYCTIGIYDEVIINLPVAGGIDEKLHGGIRPGCRIIVHYRVGNDIFHSWFFKIPFQNQLSILNGKRNNRIDLIYLTIVRIPFLFFDFPSHIVRSSQ